MNALIFFAALMGGFIVLFLFLAFGKIGFSFFKKAAPEEDEVFMRSEIEIDDARGQMPPRKSWKGFWLHLYMNAGHFTDNYAKPSNIALIIAGVAGFVGLFIWPRNVLGLIALPIVGLAIYRVVLLNQAATRIRKLEEQLPSLLSGIRANLQSNMTPEKAMLAMADEIDGPLGEELQVMREEITVNVPLDTALMNMANRVNSSEIKFLLASVRLAVSSGIDLDPQIAIIQRIVVQRTRIKSHLRIAVAQVQPAMIASATLIPLGLLYSMSSSEDNAKFWGSLIGIVAFIVVGALYAAGLFVTRMQINRVKGEA